MSGSKLGILIIGCLLILIGMFSILSRMIIPFQAMMGLQSLRYSGIMIFLGLFSIIIGSFSD